MIKIKAVSSLEKVLMTDNFYGFDQLRTIKAARGERVSFQVLIKNLYEKKRKVYANVWVGDEFKKYARVSRVGHVPVRLATYLQDADDNYISKEPGLYPDVLFPITEKDDIPCEIYNATSVMVTIDLPKNIKSGKHTIEVFARDNKSEQTQSVKVVLDVKKTVMPKNDLLFTQWFHCDSIASYFDVPMMSKKHWVLIEQFIKTAARTGITMLLTPMFTPPLDTAVGGERPTMQLVGVKKTGEKYEFDFTLLDKWFKLCRKYGIEYFEMSHLYTQWGVTNCPKIVVNEDGEDKKLFGWHVDAHGDMYKNFLSQFLPALTSHLKDLGLAEKCYFHISDEPSAKPEAPDLENYRKAREFISPYLKDFKIMDALSNIEFYKTGLVDIPVCSTGHIDPFMEEDINERWTYYCCGPVGNNYSNRFLAMPSWRTRVIGIQMYANDIVGFLQWGYNFYFSERSKYKIDPYQITDGDNSWPAGDTFSVYPYKNGAIESLRTVVFYDGIQDRMLLKALEAKIGKDAVKDLLTELADGNKITFRDYPTDKAFITLVHDTVLDMLG